MLRLLAIVALLAGCGARTEAVEEPAPPPVHVDTAVVTSRVPLASGTAELEALRRATLSVEAPGRVVALDFEAGQRVSAGDVLLRLDVGRTAVAASAATAAVAQAEAAVAQAERERAIAAQLAASGSGSRRNLEQADDAAAIASAALATARAQSQVARRGLTEAVLRAPFGGTIIERRVEMGEYLGPGSPVAVLMDTSALRARVLLDPREALDVRPGAAVSARVFARPDEQFDGEVLRVGEAVDSATRRLPVEVEVRDPSRRVRPGLVARFEVVVGEPASVLTIDADCPFVRFELTQVYVVDAEGVAHRRAVTLGAVRDGRVAVLTGLNAGDRVVREGQDRVLDGQPVRVVEPDRGEGGARADRIDG
ncbi:MAG: efflux RND transporter periplasmic adaptor subunit [Sandaracinaceae bacterium]|nr:efflux RND transporter periplasmic adaptor subunit [Sandaracinaceae bacterium]